MTAVAWAVLAALVFGTERLVASAAPLPRMLALVAATFVGSKLVVLAAARAAGAPRLPPSRALLFTFCWFGMDPRAFARRLRPDRAAARAFCRRGLRNAAAGAILVIVARAVGEPWGVPLLLVGLSLLVHFGAFTLLAAWLRGRGHPVPLLFDAPWRARSPREFWTRRWNRGFAELTALVVHRPMARRFGRPTALFASFLASGLLHEIAISLPVRAGYGLPTLYFALQGLVAARVGSEPGRIPTLLAVLLPVPLVFHPPFVAGVVLPMLR